MHHCIQPEVPLVPIKLIEEQNMAEEFDKLGPPGLMDQLPGSLRATARKVSNYATDSPLLASTVKKTSFPPEKTFDDVEPDFLEDEKYREVFGEFLRDSRRAAKFLGQEKLSAQKQGVKKSIQKVLKRQDEESTFNGQFNIKPRLRAKTVALGKQKQTISGLTTIDREAQTRKYFFANHNKVVDIQEECLLREYYLKDQQGERRSIGYARSVPLSSKHRRLTPTARQSHQLYMAHDEREYKSLKTRTRLKEKFIEKCVQVAKRNITHRRNQNFKEMEYIQREHNHSLWQQTISHRQPSDAEATYNNNIMRLFLNYKFERTDQNRGEEQPRADFTKFKADLMQLHSLMTVKEPEIDAKTRQMMRHKRREKVNFIDFKELVMFVNEVSRMDILPLFMAHFPAHFRNEQEEHMLENWTEIDRHFSHHKTKLLLSVIFHTFPDKLIGKKYLPAKAIPGLLRAYGITEKDYSSTRLFHSYQWGQHHDVGLTFDEFYRGSVLLGMKGHNWRGIEKMLAKVDVKQYL